MAGEVPLARVGWCWHGSPMDPRTKLPRAGGVFLAAAVLAGAAGGVLAGQPSIGLVVGTAVGLVLLGAVWLIDRRR